MIKICPKCGCTMFTRFEEHRRNEIGAVQQVWVCVYCDYTEDKKAELNEPVE